MKQDEWIRRLERAKVAAVRMWRDMLSLNRACDNEDLIFGRTASFDLGGKYQNNPNLWSVYEGNSPTDIARVFDKSIEWAKKNPKEFEK